jgi:hypothetical protein
MYNKIKKQLVLQPACNACGSHPFILGHFFILRLILPWPLFGIQTCGIHTCMCIVGHAGRILLLE